MFLKSHMAAIVLVQFKAVFFFCYLLPEVLCDGYSKRTAGYYLTGSSNPEANTLNLFGPRPLRSLLSLFREKSTDLVADQMTDTLLIHTYCLSEGDRSHRPL